MAERRTFSKKIIESGRMMKLPPKIQLLYIHLCMNADDDGVAEAFAVLSMLGVSEKELTILEDKGFIRILDEDLVCFITDWVENNPARSDRIKPSIYRDLLAEKVPDARLQQVRERADRRKHGTSTGQQTDAPGTSQGRPMDSDGTSSGRPRDDNGTSMGHAKEGPSSDSSLPENERKDPSLPTGVMYPKESTPKQQGHGSVSWINPPTLKDVQDYFAANCLKGDPQVFFDTFSSVGWLDKFSRLVTDWRAAARRWASRENSKSSPEGSIGGSRDRPRDYDGSYDAVAMTEVTI